MTFKSTSGPSRNVAHVVASPAKATGGESGLRSIGRPPSIARESLPPRSASERAIPGNDENGLLLSVPAMLTRQSKVSSVAAVGKISISSVHLQDWNVTARGLISLSVTAAG